MVNLQLTDKEWYFLNVQIEEIIRKNSNNYIAKNILTKLTKNYPKLDNDKPKFETEYECIWVK